MRSLVGLHPEAVAMLEHLEACRHLASDLPGRNEKVIIKGLEALARLVYDTSFQARQEIGDNR